MRILACADLHGVAERIARVRELAVEHAPDVVVLAGDLTDWEAGGAWLDLTRSLPMPVLAVAGNMDGPRAALEIAEHGRLAGEEPLTIGGVTFGGPAVGRSCDLVVVHLPPLGTLDAVGAGEHIGSRRVRELIVRLRPRALVCGHVHDAPGIARAGPTLVVNCSMGGGRASGALLEIGKGGPTAKLLP